jgi:hypothetical protein
MCHFITGFLSADSDPKAVQRIADEFALRWIGLENPSVERHLHSGEGYYYTTKNHCDCGTALGALSRGIEFQYRQISAEEVSKERQKLRKKGWTESKIERHLQAQQRARSRHQLAAIERLPTADHPVIQRWLAFVGAVRKQRVAKGIGLLLHWYRSGLQTENIAVRGRAVIRGTQLSADLLLNIEEDMLYEFVQ